MMLELALSYLDKGFSIFPFLQGTSENQKNIFPISWMKYQIRPPTREQVINWWTTNPDFNIGIVTGRVSNLTVIDFDVKSGGLETLQTLKMPPTYIVKTGGGGYHYYYRYSLNSGNKTGILPGVDIRSEGGFVVAAGSTHYTGNKYEVVVDEEFALFPLETLPLELLKKQKLSNKQWAQIIKSGAEEGKRNDTLTRLAGLLFNRLERDKWGMAKELCYLWAEHRCSPPIPNDEFNVTILSIANKELAKQVNKKIFLSGSEFAKLPKEEQKKIVENQTKLMVERK